MTPQRTYGPALDAVRAPTAGPRAPVLATLAPSRWVRARFAAFAVALPTVPVLLRALAAGEPAAIGA
ncbi:hypothetical protein AB0D04_20855 [Streptomyces sp. NPDC048483]|uniref:hypothetical protein n=1 Tax=Streptomyces sp. NPDC048483 TaxID=3154927 RepID=UPI003424EA4C